MTRLALAVALALGTLIPALAQDLPPLSPAPVQAVPTEPITGQPTPVQPGATAPASLDGVRATLSAPRAASGPVNLTLTLSSSRAAPVALGVPRDNDQNCVTAPTVRVLRVGTREVVYPPLGAEPRFCTQDLRTDTLGAGETLTYTRTLDLPAGEYMVEGWLAGFADDLRVKVPAQPLRVTVR